MKDVKNFKAKSLKELELMSAKDLIKEMLLSLTRVTEFLSEKAISSTFEKGLYISSEKYFSLILKSLRSNGIEYKFDYEEEEIFDLQIPPLILKSFEDTKMALANKVYSYQINEKILYEN